MYRIVELPYTDWSPALAEEESRCLAGELELGKVLYLPGLGFGLQASEAAFLDPRWLSGTHKSVSYEPVRAADTGGVRGAQGSPAELAGLAAMIGRFQADALALIRTLFPGYAAHLRIAPTSFRPGNVESHKLSWRKDDTLLHVDAFPSRPNRGERILRVFTNVHPGDQKRVWKVGDLFEQTAAEFLHRVPPQTPGAAHVLKALRITKSHRSKYDHYMLRIHDAMKLDVGYQSRASHLTFGFPPGSTWVCFSDQTAHAALAGQFMMEQTMHLPIAALYFPERSPLKVLERLHGGALA
ncbi:MAG TPA: Kdo hydroxylase family protein [Burkholderiales bacterium]|jgi:hypothetical protein|nr:Kdo hydroxylase family protein [Burkholderiales bacterium]